MREIEWKPIITGISVTLALFIAIRELLRFCCSRGEFNAHDMFLFVLAAPYTAFFTITIILFPIAFLPLGIGSFIVGRYSNKDVLLQKLSTGIFYYLLSLVVWSIVILSLYTNTSQINLTFIIMVILRIFDILIFLGLSLLFYKIGMNYRKKGEENVR